MSSNVIRHPNLKSLDAEPLDPYVWDGQTTYEAYISATEFETGEGWLQSLRHHVDYFEPFCLTLPVEQPEKPQRQGLSLISS